MWTKIDSNLTPEIPQMMFSLDCVFVAEEIQFLLKFRSDIILTFLGFVVRK